MKRYLPLLFVAAIGIGCQNSAPAGKTDSPKDTSTTAGTSTSGTGTAGTGTDGTGPNATAAKDGATASLVVPTELKGDAYEYYGLADDKPMDLEINQGKGSAVMTGSQTTKLTAVDGASATFRVTRTGSIAQIGENELTLDKSGIYIKSASYMKVGPKEVELPNGLTPGKTWTANVETDRDGQKTKISSTYKVVGPAAVKTPVASYPDALLITSTGQGVMNGEDMKLDSRMWLVKGRGTVKTELVRTPKGGKPVSMVIQETK